MKQLLILVAFILAASDAFSQDSSEITTGILLSPLVTATKMLEMTAVLTLKGVQSTRSSIQSRGVAGKEQLKDEIVNLNEAMEEGKINGVEDVEQPALRELFEEIMADKNQLADIDAAIDHGPEFFKLATVVTLALMLE
jgi:hypothetical protein